jgi:tripartite-type tricarboxylate transporter receptor subunit TctC
MPVREMHSCDCAISRRRVPAALRPPLKALETMFFEIRKFFLAGKGRAMSPQMSVVFALLAMTIVGTAVKAQEYPTKPIRIITSEAGGGGDFAARMVAQGISGPLGQQAIVDNRPGGGIILGTLVSKAPPDGYTLLITGVNFWLEPLVRKAPYDPIRDFTQLSLLVNTPNVLVVHPSLPAKSVRQLIDLAKARPGQINYAAGPQASLNHLAGELFSAMAGITTMAVFYKSSGQSLIDLIGGHVQLMIVSATSIASHVKSGRLRALAVASLNPSALLPELPTVAATVPGYVSGSTFGMLGPAKLPASVVSRLNREAVHLLNQPDVKEKFLAAGAETVASSPEAYAEDLKAEISKMSKLIKDLNIRLD